MHKVLKVVIAIPTLFFIAMGVRWAIDPNGAADVLGMPLLDGLGLSTQLGDMGSFFMSVGLMMLLALISQQPSWFYSAAMLLLLAAGYRLIAWAAYGAAFALQEIAVEIIVGALLVFAAQQATRSEHNA